MIGTGGIELCDAAPFRLQLIIDTPPKEEQL